MKKLQDPGLKSREKGVWVEIFQIGAGVRL